jgi:hypothetical protein
MRDLVPPEEGLTIALFQGGEVATGPEGFAQRRKGGRGLLDGLRARTEAMAKSTRAATRAALASHVGILPGEEIAAGTLIRHTFLRPALAIVTLPIAMVFSSFGALLVATVGTTALLTAGFGLTGRAANTAIGDSVFLTP